MNDTSTSSGTAAPLPRRAWHSRWLPWLLALILAAALALTVWQWLELRGRINVVHNALTRHLSENNATTRQTEESMIALRGRVGELESRLTVTQKQQATLENLYREFSANREERLLAEVEQGVVLAAQQLQLAANVSGAVAALQSADERLAGNESPSFVNLRKVLVRDLDRLRALPRVDIPGLSARLESVLTVVDTLPLINDGRPQQAPPVHPEPAAAPGTPASGGSAPSAAAPQAPAAANPGDPLSPLSMDYWRRVGTDVWHEVRGLVRIQRFERDEPPLLAPGQDFFLRENIKLRLLSARLALLGRDQATFQSEVKQALSMLDRYYDGRAKPVNVARETLAQLASAELSIEVPNIEETLTAVRNFKNKVEHP